MNKSMNIRSPKGTKIVYAFPENGYTFDQDLAKRSDLIVGEEYTVSRIIVRSWDSKVFLEEKPDIGFNTVLFKNHQ